MDLGMLTERDTFDLLKGCIDQLPTSLVAEAIMQADDGVKSEVFEHLLDWAKEQEGGPEYERELPGEEP